MANRNATNRENQDSTRRGPSHEAAVKGGQHSHGGRQATTGRAGGQQQASSRTNTGGLSREAASKGGQHSHGNQYSSRRNEENEE